MEAISAGVVVGLFHAISQKLLPFTEWETERYGNLLNNNVVVCDVMTELRSYIAKHDRHYSPRETTLVSKFRF
jgi:hypothetical protein